MMRSEPAQAEERMASGFDRLAASLVTPALLSASERAALQRLQPARALPSNAVLVAVCVGVFVVLAIALAWPFGFVGLAHLTAMERVVMLPGVVLAALVLAVSTVEQMIPGARRRVPALLAILVAVVLVGGIVCVLFPDFGMIQFARHGMPCLRLGVMCAIPAGAGTWLLMRTGYLTDPLPAALTAGALSGMLGVGVLALHCGFQNAAHILVWHMGVIAVAMLGGLVVGGLMVGGMLNGGRLTGSE